MKKPSLAERLAIALLSEIASGHYSNKRSFLSRREIMRLWKVSSPTATKSLRLLEQWNILRAHSRSGQHFCPRYLQTALLQLNKTQLAPLPGHLSWEARARMLRTVESKLERIAVISICEAHPHRTGRKSGIPEKSLSIPIHIPSQVIFNKAHQVGVSVDFYIDNGTDEVRQQIIHSLIGSGIQGVILLRRLLASPVAPLADPLLKVGMPVVAVFDNCEHLHIVSVNFNNVGLGYKAGQIFLQEGHRRLAVLLPEAGEDPYYYRDRFHGVELAVGEFNAAHPDDPAGVIALEAFPSPGHRHRPCHRPLQAAFSPQNPERPTAVLSTAVGLLKHLKLILDKAGLAIPHALSVIMCSTTPTLPPTEELISIMKLDFEKIGAQAFAALELLFANRYTEKVQLIDSYYEPYGTVLGVRST